MENADTLCPYEHCNGPFGCTKERFFFLLSEPHLTSQEEMCSWSHVHKSMYVSAEVLGRQTAGLGE